MTTAAASRCWSVWSTTAEVIVTAPAHVVTAPGLIDAAADLVRAELTAVDAACSRFRADAELTAVEAAAGVPVVVTALLAELVTVAVDAASSTDGAVDPTLGGALATLGYDRDISLLDPPLGTEPGDEPVAARALVRRTPRWDRIAVRNRTLTLPPGVHLDLGATAKAHAADRAAALVFAELGCGVLVNLGGDIATAGPAPDGGWQVLVGDQGDEPRTQVSLPAGSALATSSTVRRRWHAGGTDHHHVLDPTTGSPVDPVWRTVSVAAGTCVLANTLATAAIVHGATAPTRLAGAPARLVDAAKGVRTVGGWPAERAAA